MAKSKSDKKPKTVSYREEIIALLKNGSTKKYVAKKYKTTPPNLHNWLKKNGIDTKSEL